MSNNLVASGGLEDPNNSIHNNQDGTERNTLEHPLEIYTVAKNVIKYLGFKDLLSTRTVCKTWNHICQDIFHKICLISLGDLFTVEEFMNQNLMESNTYQNYAIRLVDGDLEKNLIVFTEFWNRPLILECIRELSIDLSPELATKIIPILCFNEKLRIRKLKIRVLNFFGKEITEDVGKRSEAIVQQLNCFLKSFEYSTYSPDDIIDEFHFPISWKYFFNKFSYIQELSFTGIGTSEMNQILYEIENAQGKSADYLSLKKLMILNESMSPESPTTEHLQQLLKIRLETLTILGLEIGFHLDYAVLISLLRKTGTTLNSLQLRKFSILQDSPSFNPTESFPQLTCLNVSENFSNNINFSEMMPSLMNLQISIRNYSKLQECKMIDQTTFFRNPPPLKMLTIEPLIGLESVRKIVKWFPELTFLKIRVDNIMSRIIFAGLKKLVEIYLIGDIKIDNFNLPKLTLTDEGITGIPIELWKLNGSIIPERDRQLPYIGNLKLLEKVTIESWHDYGNGITDFSICYGFMDLPKLKTCNLERTLISKQGFKMLEDKLFSNIENMCD